MADKPLDDNSKVATSGTLAERLAATVWQRPGSAEKDSAQKDSANRDESSLRINSHSDRLPKPHGELLQLTGHKPGVLPHLKIQRHDHFDHSGKGVKDTSTPHSLEEKHSQWRGKDISLTLRNGVPARYKDGDGAVWTSDDGKGWIREGEGSLGRQAKITFDNDRVREESPYGVTKSYLSDGSLQESIKTANGETVVLSRKADGSQTLNDGTQSWVSLDGKNWTNGKDSRQAEYRIDENGRLFAKGSDGVESTEKSSMQFSEIDKRIDELSAKYNIKFGKPPERIQHEEDDPPEKLLDLRYPTKDELDVLEQGLRRFAHVAKKDGTDFGGLRFNWVASNENALEVTEHGWHDGGKQPTISIAPKDAARTFGWAGFEGTLVHEIGHQLQELFWKNKKGEEQVPAAIPKFFGFEPAGNKGDDNLDVYNMVDRDGKKWQSAELEIDGEPDDRWVPVRNGKASNDPAESISNSEMRARIPDAKKPVSDYFPHPDEAHAEALAMLLLDSRRLYHINPNLHAATKKWDQSDINYRYGFKRDESGWVVPKMLRGVDGYLVQNTAEARKQIAAAEEQWKHEPRNPQAMIPHNDRRCNCHH